MLCIINYGSGNIGAIANICKRERIPHLVTDDPKHFKSATHFLLPGVGAFDPTILQLRNSGIIEALEAEVIDQGKPLLGVCVGMHILAEFSEEGKCAGLGWIPGIISKIPNHNFECSLHLPHMGWNSINADGAEPLLHKVNAETGFYFLHSYYFSSHNREDVMATVNYGEEFPCIVRRANIIGAQFHPEKSHYNGIRLIKNFVEIT